MVDALDVNLAAYEEQRADLELESFGRWVLFHNGQLVNVYDDYEFAAESAQRRFSEAPYLLRQIGEDSLTLSNSEVLADTTLSPLDLPEDTEKRSKSALTLHYGLRAVLILFVITLWIADRIITLIPLGFDLWMQLTNKSSRRVAPRQRRAWPKGTKEHLLRRYGQRCRYCGSRFAAHLLEIDHMDPHSRGGPDDVNNLQLLCRRCNGRKGDQSDQEFRRRFATLVPGRRLTPPSPPVRQSSFDAVARTTTISNELRAFRQSRYIGTRQKIGAGSLVMGIIVAAAAQVGLMELVNWDYWWILSVSLGVFVGGGLYLRAWRTGALNL